MPIKRVTPGEAHQLMQGDSAYTYVDVRSVPEWEQAHPAGSVNVPLMHLGPGGMSPNPDFLAVMRNAFPADARLLVGCRSGGRSMQAAELLVRDGFTDVVDVAGGFVGDRDPGGRVTPGWASEGLPTGGGRPYDSVAAAAAGRR
jgi:rhodanese-related sulfurtransferase